MELVDAVHLGLDIALSATLSAWLVTFATDKGTDGAMRAMEATSPRVRIGALAVSMGLLVDVATIVFALAGGSDVAAWIGLLAYPLLIGGALALASSTWNATPGSA